MFKILKIAAAVIGVVSIAFIYSSCEKRTNPVEITIQNGLDYTSSFNDTASFWFNYMGNNTYREVSVYTPPGYDDSDTATLYPVLYLLHGFGGDQDYFTHLYGLNHIADEMIAGGEIEPMIIASIDGSSQLGGGWWTDTDSFGVQFDVIDTINWRYTGFDPNGNPIDSTAVTDTNDVIRYFAGLFENLIITDLRLEVENNFNVHTEREYKGIGGHSMGGYGAMKIAMKHSDKYGSVSAMSALLTFQGDSANFFGLRHFIPQVLAENGITYAARDSVYYTAYDTLGNPTDSVPLNQWRFHHMTPSATNKLTSMMMSMASIFSPHQFTDTDTSHWVRLSIAGFLGIDLPFDYTYAESTQTTYPAPIDTVWSQWMDEDVLSLLSTYAAGLDSVSIYIDCGADDELSLKNHNDIFHAALSAANIEHEYTAYSGYSGTPAAHSNFIQERLREVLKFHSEQFNQ